MPGNFPLPVPGSTGDVAAPAAATAAVVTYAASTNNLAHAISGIAISYSAAPTGGNLQIADGANVIFNLDITAAGDLVLNFTPPKEGTIGNAMTITLASGGGTVVGKLSVLGHWLTGS